jgi:hypothetical protein
VESGIVKKLLGLLALLPALASAQTTYPYTTLAPGTTDNLTANYICAAPNGSSGSMVCRAMVDADLPATPAREDFAGGTSHSIVSADSGNIIWSTGNGTPGSCSATAWNVSIPQAGTTGFASSVFQTILWNFCATSTTVVGSVGNATLTPTTSTINGLSSWVIPPQSGLIIAADQTGNYIGIPFGSIGPQGTSQANGFVPLSTSCGAGGSPPRLAEYSTTGLAVCNNGAQQGYFTGAGDAVFTDFIPLSGGSPAASQNFYSGTSGTASVGTNSLQAVKWDSAQNQHNYGVLVAGGTQPTITCTASCPTSDASTPYTITFTNGQASIGGTSLKLGAGETVVLTTTGALPSGFATLTTYYVNSTGLTTTTFQLCAAPPTLVGSVLTACTSITAGSAGSGTQTATTGSGGNLALTNGGAKHGFFVMPAGTYSASSTFRMTYGTAYTNGYFCDGYDVTAATVMFPAVATSSYGSISKAASGAVNDVVGWRCEAGE